MAETQNTRASGALPGTDPLFAPGLKRRPRAGAEALYWIPPASAVKSGYAIKSLTLPPAPEAEIAALCRAHWASLMEWRQGLAEGPARNTLAWLIRRYETDEFSPFHALRHRSKRSYEQFSLYLARNHGTERLDPLTTGPRITGETIRTWHKKWGNPDADGKPTTPSRARHMIVHLRILASYGVEIGLPGADKLRDMLSAMRFASQPPRSAAPTREQVIAFVKMADEMGYRSMAITTLAQFELTERRTHIIGTYEGAQWRPGWVWNDIDWTGDKPSWSIQYYQTKVGRVLREFDLRDTPLLLEMLQRTPIHQRTGPVILCESERRGSNRLPWRERHYAEVWREIATAAGLPATICSMDMRAGGATEADSIDSITPADLKAAGGWKNDATVARYTRNPQRRARNVIKLRQANAARSGDAE